MKIRFIFTVIMMLLAGAMPACAVDAGFG